MNIIDTKEFCSSVEDEIKQFSKSCIIRPSVALINIGNSAEHELFVKEREEACNKTGMYFRYYDFEENTPELTIINKIKELNNDDYVNGIVISLPIPEKYNEKRLLNTIINSKDVEGLTDINVGRLIGGRKSITPCAAAGVMELFKQHEIDLTNKHIVIVGNDKIISRPLTNILLNEGATVTICNSDTTDLKRYTQDADILISCAGVKNLILDDMVKEESIIIDVGRTIEDGKVYGDVDFNKVSKKVELITPLENGVDTITMAMFLKNVIFCYNNKK